MSISSPASSPHHALPMRPHHSGVSSRISLRRVEQSNSELPVE